MGAQIRRGGGPRRHLSSLQSTAALTEHAQIQNGTHTRNHSGTLAQAPKARSVRALDTAAHDASTPCPRRPRTARRDQLRRRQKLAYGDSEIYGATRGKERTGLT